MQASRPPLVLIQYSPECDKWTSALTGRVTQICMCGPLITVSISPTAIERDMRRIHQAAAADCPVPCVLSHRFPPLKVGHPHPSIMPTTAGLTLEGPFPTLPFVSHAPYLPSLRTVTFSSFTDCPSCLFDDVATQAPNLTTISFYPEQACRNLANDLASALVIPSGPRCLPEFGSSGLRPVLPPSIKEVVVQPGPIVDPAARNAYCLGSVQELMKRKLLYMQKHDKSRRVKYVAPGPAPLASNALASWL